MRGDYKLLALGDKEAPWRAYVNLDKILKSILVKELFL